MEIKHGYNNDPISKFMDSVDSGQTTPSGSILFVIRSVSFELITLWQSHIVQILE